MIDEQGNIKKHPLLDFMVKKGIAKDAKQAGLYASIILIVLIVVSLYIAYASLFKEPVDDRTYSELSPAEKAKLPTEIREIAEELENSKADSN